MCSRVTTLTVRQLISFAFIKLHPHVYVDIHIQLLLLSSLCICTKACRLQILTVIILGHSSLIHVFLSYFLFKNQFCANRHTSIYSASLLNSLDWFQAFRISWGMYPELGFILWIVLCNFSAIFFLVIIACLFVNYWLFKFEVRSNERHPALIPTLLLRGEPPLQPRPQTLVLSLDAPSPHGWLVLRHWACVPLHPSTA